MGEWGGGDGGVLRVGLGAQERAEKRMLDA